MGVCAVGQGVQWWEVHGVLGQQLVREVPCFLGMGLYKLSIVNGKRDCTLKSLYMDGVQHCYTFDIQEEGNRYIFCC